MPFGSRCPVWRSASLGAAWLSRRRGLRGSRCCHAGSREPAYAHPLVRSVSCRGRSRVPCDYEAIRHDNVRRFGTDIGRIGKDLLANRYADRTHFVYELLQNAEDALRRRKDWNGSRAVNFDLRPNYLRVSHSGVPFDEDDVRGLCGIAESTKDLTSIGRFGIGFKSVFAFTDRPEIHSGIEHFAIENYVWPVAIETASCDADETVFLIPFSEDDEAAVTEIATALDQIGTSSLLFLSEIEEITWSIDGVAAGQYLREARFEDTGVRRVTVVGEKRDAVDAADEWIVFSNSVHGDDNAAAGAVEIAWQVQSRQDAPESLRPLTRSPLVAYFPTAVDTRLGFLIQGPYRTTPSRDNVPPSDKWNQLCVEATGTLLVTSLLWLRDNELLSPTVLEHLPIVRDDFEDTMFFEMHRGTMEAFALHELLPNASGGYVRSTDACLGRGSDLRGLVSPNQLASLLGREEPVWWLHGDISRDRTPRLHDFLVNTLEMREIGPEILVQQLTRHFLEEQDDPWLKDLYAFLGNQRGVRLRQLLEELPIVRLVDGSQVSPCDDDGEPVAFLPGPSVTSFPTVRASVCSSDEACEFLRSLGLSEADPVDNVIRNILPRYGETELMITDDEYETDVNAILDASETDSMSHRDRLYAALGEAHWVMSLACSDGSRVRTRPTEVYLATERLQSLFDGVDGVWIVDHNFSCLRGESIRSLLMQAGASRHLRICDVTCDLSADELREMRRSHGLERSTWGEVGDKDILGLGALLDCMSSMDEPARTLRASELWEALIELESNRGAAALSATYTWGFHDETQVAILKPAFIRTLNETSWVPDVSGGFKRPQLVDFVDTGWKPNSVLQSHIEFKPNALSLLAHEAGIDPGVLDLLRELGVTSEAELRARLRADELRAMPIRAEDNVDEESASFEQSSDFRTGDMPNVNVAEVDSDTGNTLVANSALEGESPREFFSYVGVVSASAGEADPDGLAHTDRMALEQLAIEFILEREPDWQLTPVNNPGFDLYRGTTIETATEWCEIKAMKGSLDDRPVGMSRTQFEHARKHGEAYWLYVVEQAGTDNPHLVQIQNPAGKAKTYTFDRGWRSVTADSSDPNLTGVLRLCW